MYNMRLGIVVVVMRIANDQLTSRCVSSRLVAFQAALKDTKWRCRYLAVRRTVI